MVSNLCAENKVEMAINLRQTFRNFILDCNFPEIIVEKQKMEE
jgi:hypothetical protein